MQLVLTIIPNISCIRIKMVDLRSKRYLLVYIIYPMNLNDFVVQILADRMAIAKQWFHTTKPMTIAALDLCTIWFGMKFLICGGKLSFVLVYWILKPNFRQICLLTVRCIAITIQHNPWFWLQLRIRLLLLVVGEGKSRQAIYSNFSQERNMWALASDITETTRDIRQL
jgi:hypothetical protein